MPGKKYTDKQKIAYYKKKAMANAVARPRRRYVKGQGAYQVPRDFFSAPRIGGAIGGAGGALIGSLLAPGIGQSFGSAIGGAGGRELGKLFKKVTGWGDYQVKQNSLMYANEIVPSFGDDSIRVRKREFIATMNSTEAVFTLKSFPINPGLDTSFPWLSAIARNYEQYRVNGMIFQFVSTSSDAIASTTALGLGQVILATDYNAADHVFQDSPQMLNYMFSNSGKPSDHILHAIECAPTDTAQKLYYVRTGAVPSGQDPRLYDLGVFQIAVDNMPATYTGMGQLWVSYDITFVKSQQNNQLGWALNTDWFDSILNVTNANFLGDGLATAREGSNLGCTLNSTQLFFPENLSSGYYLLRYSCSGGAATVVDPTLATVNCDLVNCWGSVPSAVSTMTGGSNARYTVSWIVKITDDNARITFAGATLPTSVTLSQLLVTQVNGDIYDEYGLTS